MEQTLTDLSFKGIIYNDSLITGEQFVAVAASLCATLKKYRSTLPTPFVHLTAINHPKTIAAWYAAQEAGYSCVLIDPDWKKLELDYMLADTPPSVIIRISPESALEDFSKDITFIHSQVKRIELPKPYTIVYTAAENGFAKGAMLSQKNIWTNARAVTEVVSAESSSVYCSLLPQSHLFGLTTGVFAPMLSHSSFVIEDMKNISKIEVIADNLQRYGVTHLYTIPLILHLLSRVPGIKEKLRSVRYVISGGYKLPETLFDYYNTTFGITIQEGYGLTEASPICSWQRGGDKIKKGSVGKAFPYCKLKIVDDNNRDLRPNKTGEICVCGDNVMEGYYNRPEETSKTLVDGWLHTGDLGTIDKEGYLFVTGLKKRMVQVGGRNVYPAELERMLSMNPDIVSVSLTLTDTALFGCKIAATIGLSKNSPEDQSRVMKWCIQNIAAYKLPKTWKFT
ncbi:MAG: AMP-binding protein [Chitinivibrionales bacterium]|nr:AMP-binding protein [Chitinivibrionales bacterium]